MKFFDGAFGTYYIEKTDDLEPCETANISHPAVVTAIHKEYIAAGVNAIKTNTFGINEENYPDEDIKPLLTAGYMIALDAVKGSDVSVYCDIGNCNEAENYLEVSKIFVSLGAKNFLFETQPDFATVKPALAFIAEHVSDYNIIVSFAVSQDGYSGKGLHYKALIADACNNPYVTAVGLNCMCGPAHLLRLVQALLGIEKPLVVMPNAGYASVINQRRVFHNNIDYFANKLYELSKEGVSILGGCCGTTPAHIKASIDLIKSETIKQPVSMHYIIRDKGDRLPLKPLAVELDPPVDSDMRFLVQSALELKKNGVSLITLSDSPLAKCRADSILTAAYLKKETGVDVLPHMTCRDKNYIAIKGALIGAGFHDINKVLVITGDPVNFNMNERRSAVFQFHSVALASYIENLNQEIFQEKPFTVYGAVNINAVNFDAELKKCKRKVDCGVQYLFSQPVFSEAAVENLKRAKREMDCKIYAGILPVASYRNAVFLNNEVTGIDIPDEVIKRMYGQENPFDISVDFSKGIIRKVYDWCDGFYIMTPLKKTELVLQLIRECFDV